MKLKKNLNTLNVCLFNLTYLLTKDLNKSNDTKFYIRKKMG